ncbi:nucleotidyl transferase AbiEii/AbiGii toxin family protein [Dactylosporangium sp. AC04546]|uniref:nucleotidyl transferase AbiEii/AbiGii toxin family protein n=1 Tax=Dactylosporangium sp. AC04546 TaxID=2862460 RepID=UPI001EDD2477|nr:nucleotidyl transferase AbiEii/AbiGii toxin family protein [Dactylosporangium sp. AC04546]WVK83028.1 nucleotidyl transferase AbiEii/AbiGii toxin family protein [Dactylosporangium sp. AC04546]
MPAYASPEAFRRAVTDRLRALAAPKGRWPLPDMQRQFAYDRLLARLYELDDGWIVKGATALLARGIAVRHTIDIDLYRVIRQRDAERDLRAALHRPAEDWFQFTAGVATPVADGVGGVRVPIDARIGAASWARFHVDVVGDGVRMTGSPEPVASLIPLTVPGLPSVGYQAYPIVDHIADKVCAILERRGAGRRPSTRFKDLVDLVVLTGHAQVSVDAQRAALVSEARRRGIGLPAAFAVPDVSLWDRGYAAEARRATGFEARTLTDALALVRPFIDPLLAGSARGRWRPVVLEWGDLGG